MANISSTDLFHFTKSLEILEQILETGLWARYCVERDWGDKDLLVPMVCACDIPLSDIKFHQKKYGSYGIGLNKSWAKKQGFTPVLYVSDKSDIYERLKTYAENSLVQPILCNRDRLDEEYLLYYAKRTVGTDADREHLRLKRKPKFSNEKEWRYVPFNIPAPLFFTNKGEGQDVNCNKLSKITERYKLQIEPKDIAYIFISKESERGTMIRIIERVYSSFPEEDRKCIISKIISKEQISNDF